MLVMITPLTTDKDDFDLVGVFRRARDRRELKQETIAAWMGYSAARLSDQLTHGHLSLGRLMRLRHQPEGRLFLRDFTFELALECHEDLRAVLGFAIMDRIDQLRGAVSMAKASLSARRSDRDLEHIA
jgi:hypothetical protein